MQPIDKEYTTDGADPKLPDRAVKAVQHKTGETSWMIGYLHPYKVKWDILVMLFAAWNTFQVPIAVTFDPEILTSNYIFYFNSVIDFLFFVDICVNFRTSFPNKKTGLEIKEGKEVAMNYLKTRFLVDALATIPFDDLFGFFFSNNSAELKTIGMIKMVRVLRLTRIVKFLELADDTVNEIKVGVNIFFIMVFLHCFTCFFYYMIRDKQSWIPPGFLHF